MNLLIFRYFLSLSQAGPNVPISTLFSNALIHNDVSKSFRTGHLERELQMVQLSDTRCSCIAILWVSLVSFAAITVCVATQQVSIFVVVYFVIDSVRKLLDTPPYASLLVLEEQGVNVWIGFIWLTIGSTDGIL
jgi:hypothetical protein